MRVRELSRSDRIVGWRPMVFKRSTASDSNRVRIPEPDHHQITPGRRPKTKKRRDPIRTLILQFGTAGDLPTESVFIP